MPVDISFPHDKGYKFLLSSKQIFLELLQSFVHLGWVEKIDPDSLIQINQTYIRQDFKEKEADLIYRLKIKDQEVIFYILIEMQSTVDFQMPHRLLLYMTGLWGDLLKDLSSKITTRKDFKLPAIIPITLYNGANNWTACRSFKEYLTGSEQFGEYVLNFRYILIDVNRYEKKTLLELANFIGSVFLLDQKVEKNEIIVRLKELIGVLRHLSPEQFTLFRTWLKYITTAGLSKNGKETVSRVLDESKAEEVENMIYNLTETLKKMEQDVLAAKEEGIEEGLEKGLERGLEKGLEKGKIQVAKNMLAKNTALDFIAEVTGLSIEEIKALQVESDDNVH